MLTSSNGDCQRLLAKNKPYQGQKYLFTVTAGMVVWHKLDKIIFPFGFIAENVNEYCIHVFDSYFFDRSSNEDSDTFYGGAPSAKLHASTSLKHCKMLSVGVHKNSSARIPGRSNVARKWPAAVYEPLTWTSSATDVTQ